MKKSMLEIYALAVCFVTVVCFVVSLGMALYAAVGVASPEFTMNSWTYTQYQTNDAFWNSRVDRSCSSEEKPKERPNDLELSKLREAAFARAVQGERRESTQMVVKTVLVMLIDLVVFLFHWQIAKRARVSAA